MSPTSYQTAPPRNTIVASAERRSQTWMARCVRGAYSARRLFGVPVVQFADPDVAVASRLIVVLQQQRQFPGMRLVGRARHIRGGPGERDIVLHQYPVMQRGDVRGTQQFAGGIKAGPVKNDFVGLPLARRQTGVDQRRILSVNRSGLSVGVGLVLIGIQNLELVFAHQIHAAVTALLVVLLRRLGRGPFYV